MTLEGSGWRLGACRDPAEPVASLGPGPGRRVALLVDAEQLAELPARDPRPAPRRASTARTSAGSSTRGTTPWGSARSAAATRVANHAATAGPRSQTIAAAEDRRAARAPGRCDPPARATAIVETPPARELA
jgi:hypothetical protein